MCTWTQTLRAARGPARARQVGAQCWVATQKVVTLSSGEAELAGLVKGFAESLGLQSLALDLGFEVHVRVYADSSAAIGVCNRSGIGRVRHLAVGQLWIQEKVRSGEIAGH